MHVIFSFTGQERFQICSLVKYKSKKPIPQVSLARLLYPPNHSHPPLPLLLPLPPPSTTPARLGRGSRGHESSRTSNAYSIGKRREGGTSLSESPVYLLLLCTLYSIGKKKDSYHLQSLLLPMDVE